MMEKKIRACDECGVEFGDLSMRIAGADKYDCVVCGKEYCREHIGGSLQGADSMDYDVTSLCPTHYEQAKRIVLKSRQRWWDRTCNPQGGEMEKIRLCNECGEEIEREERSLYRCVVCGGEMCSQCMSSLLPSMNGDDHEGATLCPTHYQQVKECINILKGEQKSEPLAFPILRDGELIRYAEFIPHVESATGKVDYFTVDGVKFVPEKAKESRYEVTHETNEYCVSAKTGIVGWGFRDGNGGQCSSVYLESDAADALFAYMEKEHGE